MENYNFYELMEIIRKLRGDDGCPWDREQTHVSLKTCLVEECYEVIEAINNQDDANLCEELGDVLLQVALHTAIAEESNEFTIDNVTDGIAKKMLRRHPHVFGSVTANDAEKVIENWDEIKRQEKNETTISESIQKVPRAFPANIRAEKVQKKAAKVGFDFAHYDQALDKVYEELEELKEARQIGDINQINDEFGDLMFSIINLSRFLHLNAENSLTNATDKFINRFVDVEQIALREGKHLSEMSIDELDVLWGRVKNH